MTTTTLREIDPLLRDRWSPQVYDPTHELDDADLALLLEAARWSPSAGNSQPWAFLVARRGEPAHAALMDALSRGNKSWVPAASAVLISLHRVGDDEDPALTYSDYAAYDLGQAVAHLTVQAQAMGLHTHQFAGFDHGRVAELFRVPAAWKVTTAIAVGERPADDLLAEADPALIEREAAPRVRKDLADFVFSDQFGAPRW
ncbi:nitroreductase family protein [Marmoricola sp. RAF53]|uniref:nitroreductase family protein n=1 Tax=Marmoricola sp. RAF53 TaxID=3233059 RepID=UPI003F9E7BF9